MPPLAVCRQVNNRNGVAVLVSKATIVSIRLDGCGKPKKLDTMNADLAKAGAYGRNDQK